MIASIKRATVPLFAVPDEVRHWFGSITRAEVPSVHVREWLGDVVRTHYRLLYSIAYGYCHDPSSAEDLVQSAVLSGLSKLNDLRRPEAVLGWLATITRNGCLQALRRHHRTEQLDRAEDIIAPNPVEVHRVDKGRLLLQAIDELPDRLASVVRMRFLEELSIAEIANLLGLRRNTVEVRLHRALEQLAKKPALQALKGEV